MWCDCVRSAAKSLSVDGPSAGGEKGENAHHVAKHHCETLCWRISPSGSCVQSRDQYERNKMYQVNLLSSFSLPIRKISSDLFLFCFLFFEMKHSDGFKDFLHAHLVVHKANALRALGEAAYEEERYGESVGYLEVTLYFSFQILFDIYRKCW